jgi:cell division protein FtsB
MNIRAVEKQVQQETVRRDDLLEELVNSEKDIQIEKKARALLGLVKKGEQAYQIIK